MTQRPFDLASRTGFRTLPGLRKKETRRADGLDFRKSSRVLPDQVCRRTLPRHVGGAERGLDLPSGQVDGEHPRRNPPRRSVRLVSLGFTTGAMGLAVCGEIPGSVTTAFESELPDQPREACPTSCLEGVAEAAFPITYTRWTSSAGRCPRSVVERLCSSGSCELKRLGSWCLSRTVWKRTFDQSSSVFSRLRR